MTMSNHCPRCNAENREGRRFCGACGAALPLPCEHCGFVNQADERFCGGCGSALEPQPATTGPAADKPAESPQDFGERRQVAILFADLSGYTSLAAQRDPEDTHRILGRFFEAVDSAVTRFGGLDAVFANAGIFGVAAAITEYPEDIFERVLAVNVLGPFHVAKHALPKMRRGGSLTINSSVVGLMADAKIGAYATSKHAVVGLMRTLTKEMAPAGIRVNTIHPGPVDNSFQHAIEVDVLDMPEPEASAMFAGFIPLGRHAKPEEIASVVVFLASDGGAFINGTTIVIDGGISS
jgi:NAD(P)-dependent dehydrogenase (short-subunit alcohol dehydrogenase family)